MRGILADANLEGQVRWLVQRLQEEPWTLYWESLGLVTLRLADLGLVPETPDLLLWQRCQHEQLVLLTSNRNAVGPESLEVALRTLNTAASLPVITLADTTRFLSERSYAERAAARLIEFLFDMDNYRGSGRLFIP